MAHRIESVRSIVDRLSRNKREHIMNGNGAGSRRTIRRREKAMLTKLEQLLQSLTQLMSLL